MGCFCGNTQRLRHLPSAVSGLLPRLRGRPHSPQHSSGDGRAVDARPLKARFMRGSRRFASGPLRSVSGGAEQRVPRFLPLWICILAVTGTDLPVARVRGLHGLSQVSFSQQEKPRIPADRGALRQGVIRAWKENPNHRLLSGVSLINTSERNLRSVAPNSRHGDRGWGSLQ